MAKCRAASSSGMALLTVRIRGERWTMLVKKTLKKVEALLLSLALSGIAGLASAQMLDEVSLSEQNDNVVVTVRLTTAIHYVRHFPATQGRTLDIYYDILPGASPDSQFEDKETRTSPPSDLIPGFVVVSNIENDQPKLSIEFNRNAEYSVRPGKDGRSLLIYVRKTTLKKGEVQQDLPEIVPAAPGNQDEKGAEKLMVFGRDALKLGDYPAAIYAFNKLLLLPPNKYTQEAQEWVGVARERAGQNYKSKLEYEAYLKLYPGGAGAERVKKRLAKLTVRPVQAPETPGKPAEEQRAGQTMTYGGVSMFYSHSATTINSAAANTDLSALFTTVDVSARYRDDEYDNRLVFRDSYTQNFLPGGTSRNRLSSAYFELKNRVLDYSARIGRQSATGGGVLGRFDGATVGYGFLPKLRAGAVAGQLSDALPDSKPVFYGLKLDMAGSAGSPWGGNIYAINQTVGSISDRRALGAELRYFEPNKTTYALLDYDTSYASVDIAMLQGTVSNESGTVYNFLIDHRKNLTTSNALIGATTTSLALLVQNTSEAYVRELAKARTPTTNSAQIGFSHPIHAKWQLGGDVRVLNTSSMPASGASALEGITPFTAGSGNVWGLTAQLIGSNIFSGQDTTLFSLGRDVGLTVDGWNFFVANHAMYEKWTFDTSLRLFRSKDIAGQVTVQGQPTFKVSYQMQDQLDLELELGLDRTNDRATSTTSDRRFFTMGFRWVF